MLLYKYISRVDDVSNNLRKDGKSIFVLQYTCELKKIIDKGEKRDIVALKCKTELSSIVYKIYQSDYCSL